MKRIRSHHFGVDQGTELLFSDFENDGEMWTGTGPREHRKAVRFAERFRGAPAVHVALSMWDLDEKTNQRADLSAVGVTPDGFELVFRTWGDTRVARVRADWLAIGELDGEDDWDLY